MSVLQPTAAAGGGGGKALDLLVMIVSAPANTNQRHAIREREDNFPIFSDFGLIRIRIESLG